MKNQSRKNSRWENLQGFRYAHRGLYHQPASASMRLPENTDIAKGPFGLLHKKDRPGPAGSMQQEGTVHFVQKDGLRTEAASAAVAAPCSVAPPFWREDIARWKEQGKRIIPENTMKAFRHAVRHGFGSELDVHLTADGRLAVFHDTNLLRMTGIDRRIEDMTWPEIRSVRLLDTPSRIPLLEEVLDLYTSGKALVCRNGSVFLLPLVIELKAGGDIPGLCRSVMETVDRYPTLNYCIESFDPRAVLWLRRNRPDVIRGQLTENFMKSPEAVRQWGHLMTFGMWSVVPDTLTRPDFISSKFPDRKNPFIRLSHRCGVRQVNWVIRNEQDLETVEREGGLAIFERFVPGRDKLSDN